jgi:hypothetical protein
VRLKKGVCAAAPALLLTVLQFSPAAGAGPAGHVLPSARYVRGNAPVVTSMASARVRSGRPPLVTRIPRLRSIPRATAGAPRTGAVIDVAHRSVSRPGAASAQASAALVMGTAFPTTSRTHQIQAFGFADEAVEPPDTQLAAGPYNLLEMVNSSGSIWSKSTYNGFPPEAEVDLNAFYGVDGTPYGIGDARVQYDFGTGRWFASALAFATSTFSSRVLLAVSDSFEPDGSWTVYQVGPTTSGIAEDQPSLGVSTDKVVLSWNDFNTSSTNPFVGAETWVIQKSAVLAGQVPSEVAYGPDLSRASLIGAQQETRTATAFLAYNGNQVNPPTVASFIGIVALTGTPAQRNVAWNERHLPMAATSVPPAAEQPPPPAPATSSDRIATNDDRFTSVVWSNDVLWAAGNDRCTPPGDVSARSCAKLVKVSTAGAMGVQTDADLAMSGGYVYFPAVAMDPAGNMIVVFSQSSTSQYVSLEATGDLAGDALNPPALLAETQVVAGQGVYACTGCQSGFPGDRWGDYSAAALEPCGSSAVWVAGEYMGDPSDATDWGTAAASLTVSGSQPPPFQPCLPEDHGGILAGAVAATTWGAKRLDAFVRGTDGILYHRFVDDFHAWQWDPYLPQIQVTSDASSVSTANGSVDVFVRGTDGGLWRTTYRAATSSGTWQPLGGVLATGTAPSAVSTGNGDIAVFVEGADRQLWEDQYSSARDSWHWIPHGGLLATGPSAVSPNVGVADAFVEGTDAALWLWSPSPTPRWTGLGGRLAARPAATSTASGTVDALVEGTDTILYHWSSGTPVTPNPFWETVGGRLGAAPAATSWGGGRLDVLVRGTDGQLWHAWTATGLAPWAWEGNGVSLVGAPVAVTWGTNRLDVFAHGINNRLLHLAFD